MDREKNYFEGNFKEGDHNQKNNGKNNMRRECLEKELEILEDRLEHNISLMCADPKNDTSYLRRQIRNDQRYYQRLTGNFYTTKRSNHIMHEQDRTVYGDSGVA